MRMHENPMDIEQNLEPALSFEREPLAPGVIELLTHKSSVNVSPAADACEIERASAMKESLHR
jgi:hypothetical protein